MARIGEIEKELQTLLLDNRASWVRIYELIHEVEIHQLWKRAERSGGMLCRSFTQWVRSLASRVGVHESVLWARKRAGEIYQEYSRREAETGRKPTDLHQVTVSPDNLILADRIAQNDDRMKDQLIRRIVEGDLRRGDLKAAWSAVKTEKAALGIRATRANGYELLPEEPTPAKKEPSVTAADLMLQLRSAGWLADAFPGSIPAKMPGVRGGFQVQTDFLLPQEGETAAHADALVLEDLTVPGKLRIHAVCFTFQRPDQPAQAILPLFPDGAADYLWVAGIESSITAIRESLPDWVGLLSMKSSSHLQVIRPAGHRPGALRPLTIETALLTRLHLRWR